MDTVVDALTSVDVWNESWGKEDLDLENIALEFSDPLELEGLQVLESYIDFRLQPRMIELGGAHSVNLLRFCSLGATATTIDFSHIGLKHTKELFIRYDKPVDLIEADIFDLPFSSATKFDFVFSIGLCEHFVGGLRQAVFDVHKKLIRQGGLSLIAVPNIHSPIYQLWYTASWLLQVVPSIGRRLGINIVSERAFSRRELGCVDISRQPYECADETQKSEISSGQFLETGKDSSIMLDFIDETLRQMALFIPVFVIVSALFTVLPWWNNDFSSCIEDQPEKILCIIRTISNQAFKIQLGHQSCRLGDVVSLATGQAKAQGVAQGIHAHVDFGAETTSAATERLFALASVFLMRQPHTDGLE